MTVDKRDATRRRQLHGLSKVLRPFGLSDVFGVADLLDGKTTPSVTAIERKLRGAVERIPASLSPQSLAEIIQTELGRGPTADSSVVSAIAKPRGVDLKRPLDASDIATLADIPIGRKGATRFHRHSYRVLSLLFQEQLADGAMEVKRFGGRIRADIKFRNLGAHGSFFGNILSVHKIHAPYVWTECKNYHDDARNNELAQLSTRLNDESGRLGLLICRTVSDRARMHERQQVFYRKGEYMLILDDEDMIGFLQDHIAGDGDAVDSRLEGHLSRLRLN